MGTLANRLIAFINLIFVAPEFSCEQLAARLHLQIDTVYTFGCEYYVWPYVAAIITLLSNIIQYGWY